MCVQTELAPAGKSRRKTPECHRPKTAPAKPAKPTGKAKHLVKKQASRHGKRRTQRVYVRVDDEEKERISSLAREKRMTISRVVIDAVNDAYFRSMHEHERQDSPIVEELRRIRSEIWHIGHNVNQIARLVNQELGATHADVTSIHGDLDRCERALLRLDELITGGRGSGRDERPSTVNNDDARMLIDGERNENERATDE